MTKHWVDSNFQKWVASSFQGKCRIPIIQAKAFYASPNNDLQKNKNHFILLSCLRYITSTRLNFLLPFFFLYKAESTSTSSVNIRSKSRIMFAKISILLIFLFLKGKQPEYVNNSSKLIKWDRLFHVQCWEVCFFILLVNIPFTLFRKKKKKTDWQS